MIKEILSNMYKIEVPLPRNPLRAVNCYIIKDGEKSLVIDTGMNRKECMDVMAPGLKELDVDLKKTDFFLTHIHADHSGLVSSLATDTSTIYFNKPDATAIKSNSQWDRMSDFASKNGFPDEERHKAVDNHPGRIYGSKGNIDYHIVKEGDPISIGEYSFVCVSTPGHTRGHTCLYEPKKKLLMSGDHILIDITPNISLWSNDENPLEEYLSSLDKVDKMDIELVLPGHRRSFKDFRKRIQELKIHHETRANEVLSILAMGAQNIFQVASQMTWDMSYKFWEEFPPAQKWFAFGEATSHLKYLEEKGKVKKAKRGQEVVYSLKE